MKKVPEFKSKGLRDRTSGQDGGVGRWRLIRKEGEKREKGTGIRSINGRYKIDRGRLRTV